MTLVIGFIGFGKSANRYHLPYVNLRENIKVRTIFDLKINEELARPYRAKGVTFTTDPDDRRAGGRPRAARNAGRGPALRVHHLRCGGAAGRRAQRVCACW